MTLKAPPYAPMSCPSTIDSARSERIFLSAALMACAIVRFAGTAGSAFHGRGAEAGAKTSSVMRRGLGRAMPRQWLMHVSTKERMSFSIAPTRASPTWAARAARSLGSESLAKNSSVCPGLM